MTWPRAGVAALAASLLCAGCVAPAPTTDLYAGTAGGAAAAAMSSARTAVLAVDTAQRDSLTAAALEVLLQETEASLESITAAFDSVEPPDTAEADQITRQLDAMLGAASQDARWLRIAARRSDETALRLRADSLAGTADRLDEFATEHES